MATRKGNVGIPQVARLDTSKGHTGADLPATAPDLWAGNTPAQAVPMADMIAVDGEVVLNDQETMEQFNEDGTVQGTHQPTAAEVASQVAADADGGSTDADGNATDDDLFHLKDDHDFSKNPRPTKAQIEAVEAEGNAEEIKAEAKKYGVNASTKHEAAEAIAKARLLDQYPDEELTKISKVKPEDEGAGDRNHLISTILNK